jgi:hypothetical protein
MWDARRHDWLKSGTATMASATSRPKRLARFFPLGRKASPALREAITADDAAVFQDAWRDALAKPLKRLKRNLPDKLLAMWSVDSVELNGRERELAASLDQMFVSSQCNRKKRSATSKKRRREGEVWEEILRNWQADASLAPGPWELLAISEILLRECSRISSDLFASTLSQISEATLQERIGGLFERSELVSGTDTPERQLLQNGEVPWLCSLILSPFSGASALQKSATDTLQKLLMESSDSDGILHGNLVGNLNAWLAPLARSAFWSHIFEQPLWEGEVADRLARVIEKASLLILPPMHLESTLQPADDLPPLSEVIELVLPMLNSPHEKTLTKLLRESRHLPKDVSRPRKLKKKEAPGAESHDSVKKNRRADRLQTSWQSDSSCVAILRSGTEADADLVTLNWHSADVNLLLSAAGVPIFQGAWSWQVSVDDEIQADPSTWKCSCWFLDPETVFVELEGEDSALVKRVRQVMLAPRERFVMLTDSATCRDPKRRVTLRTKLPLSPGTICSHDAVTREVILNAGPRTVRSFPVWLSDDRIQHELGSYQETSDGLELTAVGAGGVTVPLALDWHPMRTDDAADWSRLTVTETRRVNGTHEASGHRIRIGSHQVLIYRSLMPGSSSRTVLGLHTWDESVYTRLPAIGCQMMPLVEVESPE